jgi:hypothetical protein
VNKAALVNEFLWCDIERSERNLMNAANTICEIKRDIAEQGRWKELVKLAKKLGCRRPSTDFTLRNIHAQRAEEKRQFLQILNDQEN